MSRRDALKTHTYKSMDPTGTTGALHQAESTSNAVEFSMQAGRTLLVQDVRTSFVPTGQRYKMVGEQHHIVANQQILQREQKRAAQIHGVERLVLKDLHDRTHHNDGSVKTWHPSVVELLSRFPPESQDEMILTDMNIGQMPQHMEILRHIRKVDLANNKIHRLSEGISQIHGLEELILTNNQLAELPRTLNLLSSLRVLNVRANNLTALPDLMGLKSMQDLNASDNDLEFIHESIKNLSQLTVLDVRYCQLREIPDSLCDLQENLVTVHFDYNFILSFPKPIGRLKGLRNLNLSKNEIKTVPIGCLEYMTGLQKLDLSQNCLIDIPSTIGINQGLRELILNNNLINLAPRSLVALTGLVRLNFACNHLKRIPEVTTLTNLTELRLENNCLERLPLNTLETRGNEALKIPPVSIAYQGKHSIMQWLVEEDAREKKAGLRDARLRGVVQRFIEKFPTQEALTKAFHAADSDGSGSMTLIELDEWIKSLGIHDLSFVDVQFLGTAMDQDNSGFVEAEELSTLYDRFKHEQLVKEEEEEEMDEAYIQKARDSLRDEEMQEAADTAAAEAADARRKFLERRKSREDAKKMAKEAQ